MMPLLAGLALLAQVAASTQYGYRFPLPAGFADFPEAAATNADIVQCWSESAPAAASGALIMCVQRLHGTIGREGVRQQDLPPGAKLVHYTWKGFNIDGSRMDTVESGNAVVILAAQVPLRGEAVNLIVTGPQDQTSRVEAIMTATLAGFEGESNWLTSTERSGRLGNIAGVAFGIALLVFAMRIWRRRQQTA
ncbi:MAG TPA: hypothetical protein VNH63_05795 [Gemmatimonadales bacterium]|nr:hypothetical protein [Gemmatimonadales bacterium]